MKTMLLKNRIFSIMMLAFIALSLVSCDKEDGVNKPTLKEELTGTWDITSYKLRTTEYIGFLVEKANISFSAYTGAEGAFQQEVFIWEELPELVDGTYSVNETKHELTMKVDGEFEVAKITITNGKDMLWESVLDGNQLVIKATKR